MRPRYDDDWSRVAIDQAMKHSIVCLATYDANICPIVDYIFENITGVSEINGDLNSRITLMKNSKNFGSLVRTDCTDL